jgi:hypothetical protein
VQQFHQALQAQQRPAMEVMGFVDTQRDCLPASVNALEQLSRFSGCVGIVTACSGARS